SSSSLFTPFVRSPLYPPSFPTRRSSDLDEGHSVLSSKLLLHHLEPLVKQRRHFGLSVAISDQDLRRLPLSLLAQASIMIMHQSTDRKSTRLNSSHQIISYAVFCLKKKKS